MPLSADYLYKFDLNLIKKNQAGGLASKEWEFHWNDAQRTYQDDLLGRFQANNNGKEGANTGMIENETILQKLSPFIVNGTLTIASGNSDKPTDFLYRLALRIGNYDVYKINYNQISNVALSVIDPASITNNQYYFVEYQGYYSFLPNTVTTATLDYVKVAANVIWGYTFDADDRQVYNPGTSTQPLWDSNSCMEISKRMLTNLGVAFKDQDFEAFGQKVQQQGE